MSEALIVAYYMTGDGYGVCDRDGCDGQAAVRVEAIGGTLREVLCPKHGAQHMRGNAYALAGPDDVPDALEAQIMNELDNFPLEDDPA